MAKTYKLQVDIEAGTSLQKQIEELEKLVKLKEELKGTKVDLFSDSDIKGLAEVLEKNEELNKSIKKKKEIIDDLQKAELKLAVSQTEHAKRVSEVNLKTQEQNKSNKQAAKETLGLVNAYDKLSIKLNKQKREVKDLIASGKALNDADRALIKSTQELDQKLKAIDKTVGENQREVGNYKDKIKEAFQETGLFSTGIGRLLITLKNLQKQMKENSKEGVTFKGVLKGVGIGLAVTAVAFLVAALKSGVEAAQNLTDKMDRLSKEGMLQLANAGTGTFNSIFKINEALDNFFEALEKSRPAVRQLTSEIEKLKQNQEDYNEISNDTTIGFKERNAALLESIKLGDEVAKKEIERAKLALDVINKEIIATELATGKGNARADLYDKQLEALLKLDAAEDASEDLLRQNAAAQRQRNVEQAIAEVELLRSKKLSANEQSAILEKQLNDEKNQLEERRKIAAQLLNEQNKTTKEEIRIFKEKTGIQFNEQALLNQTDAVKLANQLKSIQQINEEGELVGIGEEAIKELAKVVNEYQKNRIKNAEEIKKLDDEEIKRAQRLAEIQRETNILLSQDIVDGDRKVLDQRTLAYEKTNEDILKDKNLFSLKIAKQRDAEFAFIKSSLIKENIDRATLLEEQAENEREKIRNTINDEKVKAAEIKKIDEKLKIDLKNNGLELQKTEEQINKEKIESDKAIAKERTKFAVEQADFAVDVLDKALQKQSDKKMSAIDKEIEAQDQSLERQMERAEKGQANTLELEQEKAAQLEIEKQKQQKAEELRQKILSYYSLLSSYAKEDPDTAITKAIRDIAISEGITAAFAEKGGIVGEVSDSVTLGSSKTHGAGNDRLMMLDKREGILTTNEMSNLGREGFYNLKEMLNNPISDDVLFPKVPVFLNSNTTINNRALEKKMDVLIEITKNKPVHQTKLDQFGNVVTSTFEDGKKHIIKTISKKPNFRR